MDLSAFGVGVVAMLGAIGGAALAMFQAWWNRKATRVERLEERDVARLAALSDTHRHELMHAYLEFLGTYARLLNNLEMLTGAHGAYESQRADRATSAFLSGATPQETRAEKDRFKNEELMKKRRELLDAVTDASSEVDEKTAAVLLLEDDPNRLASFDVLRGLTIALPADADDHARLAADIKRNRTALDSLGQKLQGAFSALRWRPTSAEQTAIVANSR